MYKQLIHSALRRMGLDVRRFEPGATYDAQFAAILSWHRVDLILDVGANTGQFVANLRKRVGFRGRIVSFEPMAAAHGTLTEASSRDPLWDVAPRTAIGSGNGSIKLNVSGNSVSSSILPMLDAHASAAPESRYVREEVVPLMSLDDASSSYLAGDSRVFIKIDTQGYETEVLRGAPKLLATAAGIQLEMSTVPLYSGQQLILDLWRTMDDAGYALWAMTPGFVDPTSGRLLQVDATFFRKD